MTHSEALKRDLIDGEGLRLVVYDDATGKPLKKGDTLQGHPTVGVGRNLAGKGITKAEALYLLENDISECLTDLVSACPWFESLDVVRQRMVLEFRFNVGWKTFREFQPTWDLVARGEYGAAADRLLKQKWARQIQPSRRDRLVRMLRTGIADALG